MRVLRLIPLLILLGAAPNSASPWHYVFESTSGKVVLVRGTTEERAAQGTEAQGGDEVATGWRGHAQIEVPERASHFEVFGSSRVHLASDEPGVLLVLETGRLKAWFDALTGQDTERLVRAPGAILAVRGTRYGVEVSGKDQAQLAVFEGVVEVRPLDSRQSPVSVRAGEACQFGMAITPRVERMQKGMDERMWDHGGMTRGGRGMSGMDGGNTQSRPPGSAPSSSSSGHMGGHRP